MEQVRRIMDNPEYGKYLKKNITAEENRFFCSHNFEHLLAVARLTYLLLLETGSPFISREMAYAAGLLHDIGRWVEHQTGEDHAIVSSQLAKNILIDAGFSKAEIVLIQKAIAQHRLKNTSAEEHRSPLSKALARADSMSRSCFCCKAKEQCNKYENQPNRDTICY